MNLDDHRHTAGGGGSASPRGSDNAKCTGEAPARVSDDPDSKRRAARAETHILRLVTVWRHSSASTASFKLHLRGSTRIKIRDAVRSESRWGGNECGRRCRYGGSLCDTQK